MSHAIVFPSMSKDLIESQNKNIHSPVSPNHPLSKKFTTRLIEHQDHFALSSDIYASKEDIRIEEEKSQATSQSNFRYLLISKITA